VLLKTFYHVGQEIDGVILEKPKDKDGAHNMLQKYFLKSKMTIIHVKFYRLSGRTHLVHTGVSLVKKSMNETKLHCFHEQSEVTFGDLNDEVITAYVESGEPL